MENFIILTSTVEHLTDTLKKELENFEFIFPEKNKEGQRCFPDGEVYARIACIKKLKNKRVVVLHSGSPMPNNGLTELELLLQILKDYNIEPEVFFTYFPYGRQDKAFLEGETNAAQSLISKLVNYYKVKKIYVIDPHFGKIAWVKKYQIVSVSAVPFLMEEAKKDLGPDVLFLSPDKGGLRRTGINGFDKKRIDSFNVVLTSSNVHYSSKVFGVVDDILETGGTLCRFYDCAKKDGAEKIVALISHGPLPSGIERVKKTFPKLYLTNSINTKEANVDITKLIASVLTKNREVL